MNMVTIKYYDMHPINLTNHYKTLNKY